MTCRLDRLHETVGVQSWLSGVRQPSPPPLTAPLTAQLLRLVLLVLLLLLPVLIPVLLWLPVVVIAVLELLPLLHLLAAACVPPTSAHVALQSPP